MTIDSIAAAIDRILGEPNLSDLVAIYFDASKPFAGHTFDTLGGGGENDRFDESDLVAVSLLDVSFGPEAVRDLLDEKRGWSQRLRAIEPAGFPLWKITGRSDPLYQAADKLWQGLVRLPGVGPTKAGKLMARKRPALIPIYDEVVARVLRTASTYWVDLAAVLSDDGRRREIDELSPSDDPDASVTTLRLLDVAIWMSCGNSTNARNARLCVGWSADPLL